jgi:HEAT repeat protein
LYQYSVTSETTHVLSLLATAWEDEDHALRRAAGRTLWEIGYLTVGRHLVGALNTTAPGVQFDAVVAILRLAEAQVLPGEIGAQAVPPLLRMLEHGPDHVRPSAALALGHLSANNAVSSLIAALEDTNPYLRSNAAYALGRLTAVTAIPRLVTMLQDVHAPAAAAAATALGQLKAVEAAHALISALSHADLFVSKTACQALSQIRSAHPFALDDSQLVRPLISLLGSEASTDAEQPVADLLTEMGVVAVPALLTTLQVDMPRAAECAAVLGRIGSPTATQKLTDVLNSNERDLRATAAYALGCLGVAEALPSLIRALDDPEPVVRLNTVRALGSFHDDSTTVHLFHALSDAHIVVRRTAARLLASRTSAAVTNGLIEALDNPHVNVRQVAAEALWRRTDPISLPALCTAYDDNDELVRLWVVRALGRVRNTTGAAVLVRALADAEDRVSLAATISLVTIGAIGAVPVLAEQAATATNERAHWLLTALVHLDPQQGLRFLENGGAKPVPKSWQTRLRGEALWRLGLHDAALNWLHTAAEMGDQECRLVLARLRLELGEYEHARRLLIQALEQVAEEEQKVYCLATLAVTLWQMGERSEAIAELREARWEGSIDSDSLEEYRFWHFWQERAITAFEALLIHADKPLGSAV